MIPVTPLGAILNFFGFYPLPCGPVRKAPSNLFTVWVSHSTTIYFLCNCFKHEPFWN